MKVIIGLDVGTTGVKAAGFALDASWRHVAVREYPLEHPAPGQEVQDPDTIGTAAEEALAECVAAAGAADVLAVALSAAMHGLIALDAELRPLTPLVTWADRRARDEARELRASGEAAELHHRTGVPVHPMTPLTKLMWFARHEPEICAAARWWVGLKDYMLWRLTGSLATELSSASATGLLDMRTRAWSPAAVARAGISMDQLPPILAPTDTLELTATRAGLPARTTVVAGAADGPLGNLGTGAVERGVAGLSLGTSGAVRMAVPEPVVDPAGTLFCYALTDAVWVVGGALSTGGVVVRWAGDALAPDRGTDAELLALAAEAPAGSDGLVMLPYLMGERAPLWDPDLRGAYLGLRREHTRAHLVRAAIEGVCLQMRLILDSLDRLEPVREVRVTGGAFRAPLWRELMAAALDRPLRLAGEAEGTALGAAALGLFALGRAPTPAAGVEQLTARGGPPAEPLVAAPELVATYRRLRASVPERLAELRAVGELFAGRAPDVLG